MKLPFTFILASLLLTNALIATAQTQAKHPGIELFEKGKYAEAVASLENAVSDPAFKSDALVWNYLGLAQIESGNTKEAISSAQKAISLEPRKPTYHVNLAYAYLRAGQIDKAQTECTKVIATDPTNSAAYYIRGIASFWELKPKNAEIDADQILMFDKTYVDAYLLKADAIVAGIDGRFIGEEIGKEGVDVLDRAITVLNAGLEACQTSPNLTKLTSKIAGLKLFYKYFADQLKSSPMPKATDDPTVTPLKIVEKVMPKYTENASRAGIRGSVMLAILFAANGKVEQVLILKRLGYGLDESAISAARKVKFEPRLKDGKPVSAVKVFQYHFGSK